jgi:hypothetical protein
MNFYRSTVGILKSTNAGGSMDIRYKCPFGILEIRDLIMLE